jgi:hypothetical protein
MFKSLSFTGHNNLCGGYYSAVKICLLLVHPLSSVSRTRRYTQPRYNSSNILNDYLVLSCAQRSTLRLETALREARPSSYAFHTANLCTALWPNLKRIRRPDEGSLDPLVEQTSLDVALSQESIRQAFPLPPIFRYDNDNDN